MVQLIKKHDRFKDFLQSIVQTWNVCSIKNIVQNMRPQAKDDLQNNFRSVEKLKQLVVTQQLITEESRGSHQYVHLV